MPGSSPRQPGSDWGRLGQGTPSKRVSAYNAVHYIREETFDEHDQCTGTGRPDAPA